MTGWSLLLRMKKLRILECCAFSILFLGVVTPVVPAERKTVTTIGGTRTCIEWTANRKKALGDGLLDDYGASLAEAWVYGYLSAINSHVEGEKDLLGVIDVDAISLWLDRYCMRNPKNDVVDGVIDLVIELRKIAR